MNPSFLIKLGIPEHEKTPRELLLAVKGARAGQRIAPSVMFTHSLQHQLIWGSHGI